jgi:hypothetical protein
VNLDQFLLRASIVLTAIVMTGIVFKGLYRRCWTFLPYLFVVWAYDAIVWVSPSFHNWNHYVTKESLAAALKLLLAIELYYRLFAGLPGARRLANWPLLGALTVTVAFLWGAEIRADPVYTFETVIPIANDGTTLVLVTILALATFFRVPADPLHRGILRGFVSYLLVYTLGIHFFTESGWGGREVFNRVTVVSYNMLLVYWSVAVWRPARVEAPSAVVRRLRPWDSSS